MHQEEKNFLVLISQEEKYKDPYTSFYPDNSGG